MNSSPGIYVAHLHRGVGRCTRGLTWWFSAPQPLVTVGETKEKGRRREDTLNQLGRQRTTPHERQRLRTEPIDSTSGTTAACLRSSRPWAAMRCYWAWGEGSDASTPPWGDKDTGGQAGGVWPVRSWLLQASLQHHRRRPTPLSSSFASIPTSASASHALERGRATPPSSPSCQSQRG